MLFPKFFHPPVNFSGCFFNTFFKLTKNLDMEIAIWSFLYDPETIEPFRSMGMRNEDGSVRPAWESWLSSDS